MTGELDSVEGRNLLQAEAHMRLSGVGVGESVSNGW